MNVQPGVAFLAADLTSGGVADHVRILAKDLTERGIPAIARSRRDAADGGLAGNEWVCLHFVCYGWATRGVLRGRDIAEISSLCKDRRVAVYMHELWIGEARGEPFKHRIIGQLQRFRITQMLRLIRPEKIYTSNPAYQRILADAGIPASILPLPGNLPQASSIDRIAARDWLARAGIAASDNTSIAAVFGMIHPEWNPIPALQDWWNHTEKSRRQPLLLAMGRHGSAGDNILATIESVTAARVVRTHEQPAPLLAGLLTLCDFGLATSPWALIGKSGTAAAFMEAGLPVLVTRNDWEWRRGSTPSPEVRRNLRLWRDSTPFQWADFLASRQSPRSFLPSVSAEWMRLFRHQSDTRG